MTDIFDDGRMGGLGGGATTTLLQAMKRPHLAGEVYYVL